MEDEEKQQKEENDDKWNEIPEDADEHDSEELIDYKSIGGV